MSFKARQVTDTETPVSLGMKDGDVIHAEKVVEAVTEPSPAQQQLQEMGVRIARQKEELALTRVVSRLQMEKEKLESKCQAYKRLTDEEIYGADGGILLHIRGLEPGNTEYFCMKRDEDFKVLMDYCAQKKVRKPVPVHINRSSNATPHAGTTGAGH